MPIRFRPWRGLAQASPGLAWLRPGLGEPRSASIAGLHQHNRKGKIVMIKTRRYKRLVFGFVFCTWNWYDFWRRSWGLPCRADDVKSASAPWRLRVPHSALAGVMVQHCLRVSDHTASLQQHRLLVWHWAKSLQMRLMLPPNFLIRHVKKLRGILDVHFSCTIAASYKVSQAQKALQTG